MASISPASSAPSANPSANLSGAPTSGSSLSIGLQFVGMAFAWGASFLFMKVALDGMTWGQIAWARILIGALTMGVIVLIMRVRLPRDLKLWGHLAVAGLTGVALPFLLWAWAEQHISSALASIFNGITPITTALMVTFAFHVEKLSRKQILGIFIGLIGVIVIISPWNGALLGASLWGQLAAILATICYGFTGGYLRKFVTPRGISAPMVAFGQVGTAAVLMLVLSPVLVPGPLVLNGWIVFSMLALGIFGTGIAFLWNINVMRAWGPTRNSTVTYLTPIIGVALGVLILSESLSWNEPIGAAIAIMGILVMRQRASLRRPR
jgi:drug/metabolite transporter (DMT)-like permease